MQTVNQVHVAPVRRGVLNPRPFKDPAAEFEPMSDRDCADLLGRHIRGECLGQIGQLQAEGIGPDWLFTGTFPEKDLKQGAPEASQKMKKGKRAIL